MHQPSLVVDSIIEPALLRRPQHWLWINLLSLDAPLVALLWQALFAQCVGIHLRPPAFAALGIAVWFIYVTDRLLDALRLDRIIVTPRHFFYWRHWKTFSAGAIISLFALGWACADLNPAVLHNGLVLLAVVIGYFIMVHLVPDRIRALWPKELAVGVIFAIGTSLATWTRITESRVALIVPVLLFAVLCWLNCAVIEYCEWKRLHFCDPSRSPHRFTLWIGPRLHWATLLLCIFSILPLPWPESTLRPVFIAGLLSGSALLWLNRQNERLSTDAIRVLADVALMSPLCLLLIRAVL